MTDPTLSIEPRKAQPAIPGAMMKTLLRIVLIVTVTGGVVMAKELPDAPSAKVAVGAAEPIIVERPAPAVNTSPIERPVLDKRFVALSIITAGSTFSDSYTTLFATQNWLAGKTNVCNVELQSAYLYGTHPTAPRAYAVASAKTAGSVLAAYFLRKHHNRFWSLPLIGISATSLQGVTQNMRACN
jgi:hypothetical protein